MSAPKTSSYGSRVRPSGGIDLYAWIFMRISGLVLLILALGHFFIMHVINSIHVIDYDFVAVRYMKIFWRCYDLTMLWLALIHGANGLRLILEDYIRPPLRKKVVSILIVISIAFLLLGSWVIIVFKPEGMVM